MDNYKEQEATTTDSKVKFTISADGKTEFDATGVDAWALNDAINNVRQVANENRQARQKIQEINATSQFASHCVFIAFLAILASCTGFTLSRVVSTQFTQNQIEVIK